MMVPFLNPLINFPKIDFLAIGVRVACGLAVLTALALWVLLMVACWRWLQKRHQQVFSLKLVSQSNLDVAYRLKVELNGLEKKVKSFWREDGEVLKPTTLKEVSYVDEKLPEFTSKEKQAKPKPGAKKQSAIGKEAKKVSTFANLIANISTVLAELLPGSLKKPFQTVASNIRQGQKSVSEVKAEKTHLEGAVNRLGKDAGSLGSMTKGQGQSSGGGASTASSDQLARRLVITEYKVTETRSFAPTEASDYQLVIRPRDILKSVSGPFTLTSQPVEAKDFPAYGEVSACTLSGQLDIRPVSAGAVVLWTIGGLGLLALEAWGCVSLIRWLLLFL